MQLSIYSYVSHGKVVYFVMLHHIACLFPNISIFLVGKHFSRWTLLHDDLTSRHDILQSSITTHHFCTHGGAVSLSSTERTGCNCLFDEHVQECIHIGGNLVYTDGHNLSKLFSLSVVHCHIMHKNTKYILGIYGIANRESALFFSRICYRIISIQVCTHYYHFLFKV